jgi:hypothetical protein
MDDILDLVTGPARAFAAGIKAADEDHERRRAAIKLKRLIERAEHALHYLDKGWEAEAVALLAAALQEAKQ